MPKKDKEVVEEPKVEAPKEVKPKKEKVAKAAEPVVTTEPVPAKQAVNKEAPAEIPTVVAEEIPHEITEEDLKNNPELVGEVEVGEIIGIPVDSIVSPEAPVFPVTETLLSDQAIKWKKYLQLQKVTPEKFLEKYQNHPSRKFVEELIINR